MADLTKMHNHSLTRLLHIEKVWNGSEYPKLRTELKSESSVLADRIETNSRFLLKTLSKPFAIINERAFHLSYGRLEDRLKVRLIWSALASAGTGAVAIYATGSVVNAVAFSLVLTYYLGGFVNLLVTHSEEMAERTRKFDERIGRVSQ